MKPKINAVYISVTEMGKAIDFYEKILETPITHKDERMSEFRVNDFKFLLYNPKADDYEPTFGDNTVVTIQVDDVKEKVDFAEEQGCRVSFPVTEIGEHIVAQITDFNGNTIEFYQEKA